MKKKIAILGAAQVLAFALAAPAQAVEVDTQEVLRELANEAVASGVEVMLGKQGMVFSPIDTAHHPHVSRLAAIVNQAKIDSAKADDLARRIRWLHLLDEGLSPGDGFHGDFADSSMALGETMHYMTLTQRIEFANGVAGAIAARLKPSYSSPQELSAAIFDAYMAVPIDEIDRIAAQAQQASNEAVNGLIITPKPNEAQQWQIGEAFYEVNEFDHSVALKRGSAQILGHGYIAGKVARINVDGIPANALPD